MTAGGRALVIAHRGASGYEVENSLAAFRAAGPAGADAVELDVHATADGALVVHHDETVDGVHHIAHATRAQIQSHHLANGEPVPLLEEALAAVGRKLQVFVEVKSLAPRFDDVLFAAFDRGPNPAGYTVHSFDHRIIRRLGEKRPALPRGVLSSSYLLRPLAAMADAGAAVLWQERSVLDEPLVRTVHGAEGRVMVWTVDRPEEMRRFLALGVDGLVTNLPDIGRRAVDSFAP
ncbi:MAG: glycerophosphodiester phosphodiesterase [Gemmatimonadales bacterium]